MAEQEAPAEGEAGESPIALSFEIMKPALKGLARTVDGTGFALTHLELRDQNLGDIAAVSGYKHLRYMDLSGNKISDIKPLEGLDHLLSINLSQNKIAALELPALQFLQVLDLSYNALTEIQGIALPLLKILLLNDNQIASISGLESSPALNVLALHNNKLTTCQGLGMASLQALTLHTNELADVKGLDALSGARARLTRREAQVAELDLSFNKIADLEGLPKGGKLTKLVLMSNELEDMAQLDKLEGIALETLEMLDCKFEGELDRVRALRRVPTLRLLNHEVVSDETRAAAAQPETAAAE